MAQSSSIEWTDTTWNPSTGCSKVSAGCRHCYAETMAARLQRMGRARYDNGFDFTIHWDKIDEPLSWRRPRKVFVKRRSVAASPAGAWRRHMGIALSDDDRFSMTGSWTRRPVVIRRRMVDQWRGGELGRVWRAVQHAETGLERAIALAVRLIGGAEGQPDPTLGFLPLVAAFEMFTPKNTPAALVQECAAMLSSTQRGERLANLASLGRIYAVRNAIMHGYGKRPSEELRDETRRLAVAVTIGAARRRGLGTVAALSEQLARERMQ